MDMAVFQQFYAEAGKLSVSRIRYLGEVLRTLDARIDLLSRIDQRRAALTKCLHCDGTSLRRSGQTRTGLQRLRCGPAARPSRWPPEPRSSAKPEKFHRVVADMFTTVPQSCRKLGEEIGLDKMTIWR